MYRPWVNRKFGIELEMNETTTESVSLSQATLFSTMRDAVQAVNPRRQCNNVPYYGHSDGTAWDMKRDGSCGYEMVGPALTLDDDAENAEVKAAVTAIAALSPSIDRRCGFHVHVDVSDLDWQAVRRLLILWVRYEPFFFELCPPSRAANTTYCPSWRKSTWTGADSAHWNGIEAALTRATDRVTAQSALSMVTPRGSLNLNHYWRAGRVEFRLAGGTMDYEKVRRWVQLLLSLVQIAKTPERIGLRVSMGAYSTKGFAVMYMAKMLGLAPTGFLPAADIPSESTALVTWMTERHAKFRAVRDGGARRRAARAAGRSL